MEQIVGMEEMDKAIETTETIIIKLIATTKNCLSASGNLLNATKIHILEYYIHERQ